MNSNTWLWLLLALAGLGVGFILLTSFPGTAHSPPELQFLQEGSSCTAEQDDEVAITVVKGKVTIEGTMVTPNPCVTLQAKLAQSGHTLTLTLNVTASPEGTRCESCLGVVDYKAQLVHVPTGTYRLIVFHGEKRVFSEEINVP